MKKVFVIALAAVLVLTLGAIAVFAAEPATKNAVAYSTADMVGTAEQTIIETNIKVAGEPKDLVIAFTGVSSLVTRVKITGILRGSTGCLKGLTEMAEGDRIWLDRISTSCGTQPYLIEWGWTMGYLS